jgi:hypothetical protein
MTVLLFVLLLLAGVCFGLAAGGVATRRLAPVNFLGLGLLLFTLVQLVRLGSQL